MEISFNSYIGGDISVIHIDIMYGEVVLGDVVLIPLSPYMYEIHISSIMPQYRGRALEISKILMPFLFKYLTKVEKFVAMIPITNRLAIALAKRSGFKREGKLKGSIRIDGILTDQEILGISRGK